MTQPQVNRVRDAIGQVADVAAAAKDTAAQLADRAVTDHRAAATSTDQSAPAPGTGSR
jgi:hypothetical protein